MKKKLCTFSIFLFIFTFFPIFSLHAAVPIKILLVPGHDDEVWGAQYGNLKEADMNLVLAKKLFAVLKKDKRFEVHITRDSQGYTKEFSDYFTNHKEDIATFIVDAKEKMLSSVSSGSFTEKVNPPHHAANSDIAFKLYGINKWANENKMDAVIHIHFNDYVRKTVWSLGKYKGFVIYMPESELLNSSVSSKLAVGLFTELRKKYTPSNFPSEIGGLIPDQKLIALGSNDTLDSLVRSILIEYGYIYRFGNSTKRHLAYTNMANLTVAGVKNYFFPK